MLFPGVLLTAVCLMMNIYAMKVLTPVCVVSRCVADSSVSDLTPVCVTSRCFADGSVPDDEHLCDEHPDACVC